MKSSVMLLGNGVYGKNHLNVLRHLKSEQRIGDLYVIDSDSSQLPPLGDGIDYVGTDTIASINANNPEIVCVCTNTETHDIVTREILSTGKRPALFIEKPFTDTEIRARSLEETLKSHGYDKQFPLAFAYLLRFSDVVEDSINALRDQEFVTIAADIVWKKDRGNIRPSAGVHIDESTHSVDLVHNQILRAIGISPREMELYVKERLHNSETMLQGKNSMINLDKQKFLYSEKPELQDPISTITYSMFGVYGTGEKVSLNAYSTFVEGPLERKITITGKKKDMSETRISMEFDKDKTDIFTNRNNGKITEVKSYPLQEMKNNRIYREWDSMLNYVKTGNRGENLAGMEDALFDVKITEKLGTYPVGNTLPINS